jgi:hypothetical protein
VPEGSKQLGYGERSHKTVGRQNPSGFKAAPRRPRNIGRIPLGFYEEETKASPHQLTGQRKTFNNVNMMNPLQLMQTIPAALA